MKDNLRSHLPPSLPPSFRLLPVPRRATGRRLQMARVGVRPGQHLSRQNDQEGRNDQNLPPILYVSTTQARERQVQKEKIILLILEVLGGDSIYGPILA